jgi:uncharacterized protein (TIGR00255 family)
LWQENAQKPDKEIQQGLMVGLQEALAVWDDSRSREGQALQNDLEEKWKALIGLLQSIESLVEDNVETRFQVVQERMESLLVKFSVEVDETRMLQELALISDRMDVSEELTRLRAHFREFSRVLGIQGDMGRRLDFLLQECFREINTCGTKAQNHEISAKVVEFKTGLEKLREQIQNFE